MFTFRRFAPLVCCVGVLTGCAYGPLPPQHSVKTGWNSRSWTPAVPQVGERSEIPSEWKPDNGVPLREWRHIVIHHTASSGGSVPMIHEAHLGRGWDGIGYHFVIGNGNGMGDGEVEPTFRWREQMHGAHAGKNEYNQHGIGVCLVGNFQESYPSAAQLASVKRLVATLKHEYGIPSENVIAHRDVKATACPGKNFPLAEVGSSRLVPLYSRIDHPTFEVASDLALSSDFDISLVRAQGDQSAQCDQSQVDTAEGRSVR